MIALSHVYRRIRFEVTFPKQLPRWNKALRISTSERQDYQHHGAATCFVCSKNWEICSKLSDATYEVVDFYASAALLVCPQWIKQYTVAIGLSGKKGPLGAPIMAAGMYGEISTVNAVRTVNNAVLINQVGCAGIANDETQYA